MRKLKFHESKLLKKVNFLEWKKDNTIRENEILRRYRVDNREDYKQYNKTVGMITKLVSELKRLDSTDPFRIEMSKNLIDKLYDMGLIARKKNLFECEKISVSSFCRRRLAVVLVRLKFTENLKESVTFIEQGHIRVGPDVITDPSYFVTRNLEDFIEWTDSSKIKQKVMKYNDKLDDYDIL
ncbi:u3 small nucleolar ribonucleoprotein imp3 [Anaeramoeba ignava]|uniref:U3 small nucleolar ribonucleoprotein protein IMP3 n=1 Tax=Anaeramoeba ignava TaxID=1746090 RepID=A0A9Q0R9E9_ANAIG|nr:u3 small nucleolar ribonucleoprotein imp3 [Anaeramoeba ignava]|eukprot:Anaeramoba_ignava/a94657_7.p1 GENE.a94657_7~~a94657_7.p1  ORF type:complete len:182 (+),score=44.28 a94657_7:23-568(+)